MAPTPNERQDLPRTKNVSVAVTEEERQAVLAVASAMNISISDVMRSMTLDQILERYQRIRAAVEIDSPTLA